MLEALSLILFAGVTYLCLVVAPTVIEFFSCNECKQTCLKEVSEKN